MPCLQAGISDCEFKKLAFRNIEKGKALTHIFRVQSYNVSSSESLPAGAKDNTLHFFAPVEQNVGSQGLITQINRSNCN